MYSVVMMSPRDRSGPTMLHKNVDDQGESITIVFCLLQWRRQSRNDSLGWRGTSAASVVFLQLRVEPTIRSVGMGSIRKARQGSAVELHLESYE
jgi:hypothetical protein